MSSGTISHCGLKRLDGFSRSALSCAYQLTWFTALLRRQVTSNRYVVFSTTKCCLWIFYTLNVELIIYGEVDMLNLHTRRADKSCSALQTEDSVIFEIYFTKLNPAHYMMIDYGSKYACSKCVL